MKIVLRMLLIPFSPFFSPAAQAAADSAQHGFIFAHELPCRQS
jgi:hypothetical protein